MDISKLLNRPIAYHRCFVPIGGVTGAVLLSQALYWSNKTSGGWFWKTAVEWEEETGLTRREQETARKRLAGILEEKKEGVPCKLYYKVNIKNLEKALESSFTKSAIQDSGRKKNYITETTSKSITKVIQAEEELPQELLSVSDFLKPTNLSETTAWVAGMCLKHNQNAGTKYSKPFSVPRKSSTKYLKDIDKYITELQAGVFFNRPFDVNYKKHVSRFNDNMFKGETVKSIRAFICAAMTNYCEARHNPEQYNFINRDRTISMADFIYEYNPYNNVLGVSHFWKYLSAPEAIECSDLEFYDMKLQKFYEKDVQKILKSIHNNYETFSEDEKIRLMKVVFHLTKWWFKNYNDLLDRYAGRVHVLFPQQNRSLISRFFKEYVAEKGFNHPIKMFNGTTRWTEFVKWMSDNYGIDFEFSGKAVNSTVVNGDIVNVGDGSAVVPRPIPEPQIDITELERRMNAD